MILTLLFLAVIAYIIGSIPTGVLIARLCGVRDIREHGSGTMGATNVARVLGKKFFLPIFLLDAGKAYVYLWLVQNYACDNASLSLWAIVSIAIVLLLGNGYSIFLRFGPSGKGIATSVGILAALCPSLLPLLFLSWLMVLCVARSVGIASMIGLALTPLAAWYYQLPGELFFLTLFIALWGLWLHRSHLRMLFH